MSDRNVRLAPQPEELQKLDLKHKRVSWLVRSLLYSSIVAGYVAYIYIIRTYPEHEWNPQLKDRFLPVQKQSVEDIKVDTFVLTVKIPVGFFAPLGYSKAGTYRLQELYENKFWFAVLATALSSLFTVVASDITQISWSQNGSVSAKHLWFTRMADSVGYIVNSVFSPGRKRDSTVRKMVARRWQVPDKTLKREIKKDRWAVENQLRSCMPRKKEDGIISFNRGHYSHSWTRSYWPALLVFSALVYHVICYLSDFYFTLAEIGSQRIISRERGTGYELHVRIAPAPDGTKWDLVGSRKCSLMALFRNDSQGESINVNSLMGCGTHFAPATKKFHSGKSFMNVGDGDYRGLLEEVVQIRRTKGAYDNLQEKDQDPVDSDNLVMFISGNRRPWDRNSTDNFQTRGVLLTLNPVIALKEPELQERRVSDPQVFLEEPETQAELTKLQNQIKELYSHYETLEEEEYNKQIPGKQIDDEPLIEFMEAMVQFIFAHAEYRLEFNDSLGEKGGMDFGTFDHGSHVVLAFMVAISVLVFCKFLMFCTLGSFSVREVTDLADNALLSRNSGYTAATFHESLDFRFVSEIVEDRIQNDEYHAKVSVLAYKIDGEQQSEDDRVFSPRNNETFGSVRKIAFDAQHTEGQPSAGEHLDDV